MTRQTNRAIFISLAALLNLLAGNPSPDVIHIPSAHALSPDQVCRLAKTRTAKKYATCLFQAQVKHIFNYNDPGKYSAELAACDARFSTKWQKLSEGDFGIAQCAVDHAVIVREARQFTDSTDTLLTGQRLVDNGDGTVTDLITKLQWEKKSHRDNAQNYNDPHDADNTYSWSSSATQGLDGTIFTDFLLLLNGTSNDGATIEGCFAGHCDWRLPTVVELQTILEEPFPCDTVPCAKLIFGQTKAEFYWTANYRIYQGDAWVVHFRNGYVGVDQKTNAQYARAVRGGF